MGQHFICPQGHHGDSARPDAEDASRQPGACPVCGVSLIPATQAPPASFSTADEVDQTPPPAGGKPSRAGSPWPNIPGFAILGQLGRGGMGVVYRAEQVRLKREVALKMILAGPHAGPEDVARFRAEAEAVARLQHSNIVQIHEVGEQDGRPWFALEYLDGGSLDKKLAGTPQAPEQAARLVETLARAVQAAHERGIIHRDLKPANVLLTAEGTPKIADFGLAKRLDAELGQTRTGAVMGTPSYMAPEQAEGKTREVGPATDVYALGAILYELLTGRPPFLGETTLDTLDQVRTQEPVPPRRLQPKVPRDLETICLKCLRKEPARRYGIAAELAEDLRRVLAGETIRARPVGPTERLWRWCRRNPRLAAAGGLAAAALVALVIVSFAYALDQRRAADDLRAANQQADVNLAEAQRRRRQAREAVDQYTDTAERLLAGQPHLEALRHEILKKALQFYTEFAQEKGAERDVRYEAAQASVRVGMIQHDLRMHAEARQTYENAMVLLKDLSAEDPAEPNYRQRLAACQSNLGLVLRDLVQLVDAEAALRGALTLQHKLVGDFPTTSSYRRDSVVTQSRLGNLLVRRGQDAEAEQTYQRALHLVGELLTESPDTPEYLQDRAAIHNNLASLLVGNNRLEEAELIHKQARETQERLAALFPRNTRYRVDLAASCFNLANGLNRKGQYAKAEKLYLRARELRTKLVADFPDFPLYCSSLAITHTYLATALQNMHRFPEAEMAYNKALHLLQRWRDEYPDDALYRDYSGITYRHLGILLQNTGQPGKAVQAHRQAVALWEGLPDHSLVRSVRSDFAQSCYSLANLLQSSGNFLEAEQFYHRAEQIQEKLKVEFPKELAHAWNLARTQAELAGLLVRTARFGNAADRYRRALDLMQSAAVPSIQNDLAWLLATCPDMHVRNAGEAVELATKASHRVPLFAPFHLTLGAAHHRAGNKEAAQRALETAAHFRLGVPVWCFLAHAHLATLP